MNSEEKVQQIKAEIISHFNAEPLNLLTPKSTNPKDRIGMHKPPLHLIPGIALVEEAMAFKDGAEKYGPYNWRDEKVSASIYVAAALRHLHDWFDGQEAASDSGRHHLAHARACLGILLDAQSLGQMVDDRPKPGKTAERIEQLTVKKTPPVSTDVSGDLYPHTR